jgi:hypothetical protein
MAFLMTTHKTILFQILKDIYSDTTIAPLLGFKGGTAALFFYQLDRFSVERFSKRLGEDKTKRRNNHALEITLVNEEKGYQNHPFAFFS